MNVGPRPASEVLATTVRVAEPFRAKGGFVVLVHVAFSPGDVDMLHPDCDAPPVVAPDRPASWSTLAAEILAHGDHVVTKRQWGAFYGTDLELQLRRRKIDTLAFAGIATAYGVESTARQAFELGYRQIFIEDAMASRSAAEHEHTVTRIFPRMGRVRSAAAFLDALR